MANPGQIKEHMEVIGADGKHVGTVDCLKGQDAITLTKSDSPDGKHHNIPLAWVDHIDEHVHLNKDCADVQRQWEAV
jgi:hypothetical protein